MVDRQEYVTLIILLSKEMNSTICIIVLFFNNERNKFLPPKIFLKLDTHSA